MYLKNRFLADFQLSIIRSESSDLFILFNYLINMHLLSTCSVSATVLDSWDTLVTDK